MRFPFKPTVIQRALCNKQPNVNTRVCCPHEIRICSMEQAKTDGFFYGVLATSIVYWICSAKFEYKFEYKESK